MEVVWWWDLLWDLLNGVVDQKHEARTAPLECCCFVVFLCDHHMINPVVLAVGVENTIKHWRVVS